MATIRKTTYRCDACGNEVEGKTELVQLRVEKGSHAKYSYQDTVVGVKADFCAACEVQFLTAIEKWFGKSVRDTLQRRVKLRKVKDEATPIRSS